MKFLQKRKTCCSFFILLFLFLVGCSSIPTKVKEEGISSQAFFITEGTLVYAHIQPHKLKNILSGIPGSLPIIASQKISSAYIDYSKEDIRIKLWGDFPKNWLNASLWEHRFDFSNESTIRETRFKSKKTPLYISLPNRNLAYVSSKEFFSLEKERLLEKSSSQSSLSLVEKSQVYPFFLEVKDLKNLLDSLNIKVPTILRLPFNSIEAKLSLEKNEKAKITLIFGSDSKDTPPTLAVRFALNYILGKYPENPLSSLWKRVPIIVDPKNSSQVIATLELSENELKNSLGIIYGGYLKEKAKEKKSKKEEEKQGKLKSKTQENPVDILQEIIKEDSIIPLLD